MTAESGLALVINLIIAATVLGTAAVVFFISKWAVRKWSLPNWTAPLGAMLGLVGGIYLAYFQIFSDLGERCKNESAAPRIEVLVPSGYEGFVYLYFDSSLPPMEIPPNKPVVLTMAKKGVVLTGWYKDIEKTWIYLRPEIFHSSGGERRSAAFFPDSSSGELDAIRIGHRVFASGYYVGREEDYQRSIMSPDRKPWEIHESVYRKSWARIEGLEKKLGLPQK